MTGVDHKASYAQNSALQKFVIQASKQVIESSIRELCNSKDMPKCINIADLGCSSGPNAFLATEEIIPIVIKTCHEINQDPPSFQLFLNDLVGNDFNGIFKSLSGFYEKLENGGKTRSCFIAAMPGSFYGRLFPEQSIHFVHSCFSLHWLSQVPQGLVSEAGEQLNKKNICFSEPTSPPAVYAAYSDQFNKDFRLFEEMALPGHLVLTFVCKNNEEEGIVFMELLGTVIHDMVIEGKLDPVIGREKEIQRVIQILCKRRKNNACLIGEPGVGKTVLAEGLAILISNNVVPSRLTGKKIFALEMGRLVAGTTYRGDLEERLMGIVDEVTKSNGNIILFIDELHTLIGAGGSLDAANILKPALARGQVKCIGATTLEEYKKYIEKDAALKRRFAAVQVPEPCVDDALQILKGVQNKYEVFHNVKYEEEAIIACVDLSKKYIHEQFLPDKAIDLIDEAGSRAQVLQAGKPETTQTVTKNDVGNVISSMTGIPVEQICGEHDEVSSKRLLNLEETLSKHVIGQDEAVSVISRAIRRAQVGLRDSQRPVATFLFTGPTGVGKTETAKVLAREYYHGTSKEDQSMIRLDMSEYMESHSVSKLIGSPPGYVGYNEGGQLTEAIRGKPHSLVLFDEIEKAHPQIFNALLQILDDGRLTDGKGRTVDFNNTIIIMTSNVVTNEDEAVEKLRATFKPEFLNRLDEIVVFKKVSKQNKKKILEVMLSKVVERIKVTNKLEIKVTENFMEKLLEESGTNSYGARPLKRAIARLLEDKLAESILNGSIKKGDSVFVCTNSNGEVSIQDVTR